MSKPKVTRKAPKRALLPLESLMIRQVEDFSGRSLKGVERDHIGTYRIALALDFMQRIVWRRMPEEKKAWISPVSVTDRLHTLRKVIQVIPRVLTTDEAAGVSEYEVADLLSDMLEYLTIRAELAAETTIPRERRYMVTVDAPALAAVPTRKAVAA